MQEHIKDKKQTLKNTYFNDPQRIISDYNIEEQTKKDYHGREILELLQNAVDQLEEESQSKILLKLNDNLLIIRNTGKPFSKEGLNSLMLSHFSGKSNEDNTIGAKGLGFRSLLTWAETITIYSTNLAVAFTEEYASEFLIELKQNNQVRDVVKELSRTAILVAPKLIEPKILTEYTTSIEIEIKSEMLKNVQEQIQKLDERVLMFIKNLNSLNIQHNDDAYALQKTIKKTSQYETITLSGRSNQQEKWQVYWHPITIEQKEHEIALAYPLDFELKDQKLYSFFETGVEFPLPVLIHATFDLKSDRNDLVESKINCELLHKISDFFIQHTVEQCTYPVNYKVFDQLKSVNNLPDKLAGCKNLDNFYQERLKDAKVLPTVRNTYISLEDNPKYYEVNFAKYLQNENFEQLLLFRENKNPLKKDREYPEEKKNREYPEEDLVLKINTYLESANEENRAGLCKEFLDYIKPPSSLKFTQDKDGKPIYPKFILDKDGNSTEGKQIFLPPTEHNTSFPTPPEFINVVFIKTSLYEELKKISIPDTSLEKSFSIKKYELKEIVEKVIDFITDDIPMEQNQEILAWLWQLFLSDRLSKLYIENKSKIRMKNRKGALKLANKLYFGKEYDNQILEDLFSYDSTFADEFFIDPSNKLLAKQEDDDHFKKFLTWSGVARYPRVIKKQSFRNPNYERIVIDYYNSKNSYMKIQKVTNLSSVRVLDKYEDILKNASTMHILAWLAEDNTAKQMVGKPDDKMIDKPDEIFKAEVNVRRIKSEQIREKDDKITNSDVASFMRFEFQHFEWIIFNNQRYTPQACFFSSSWHNKGLTDQLAPDLTVIDEETFFTKNQNKLKDILLKIAPIKQLVDLNTTRLTNILNKLPTLTDQELAQNIASTIYAEMLKESKSKDMAGVEKVYTKYHGIQPVNEVSYLTNTTKHLPKEILKKFKIIDLSRTQNQLNISKYFKSIKPLSKIECVFNGYEKHPNEKEFSDDFNHFKCTSLCLDIGKDIHSEKATATIEKWRKLTLKFCSSIIVSHENQENELEDYSIFINSKDNIRYLKVPKEINVLQAKSQRNFQEAVIEAIGDVLSKQNPPPYQNLYVYNKEDRQRDINDLLWEEMSKELSEKQRMFKEDLEALIKDPAILSIFHSLIKDIEFDNITIEAGISLIQLLRKHTKIDDVKSFNEYFKFDLNLRSDYMNQLKALVEKNKAKYKEQLFLEYKNKTIDEQKQFLKIISQFEKEPLDDTKIDNSIDFDCQKFLEEKYPLLKKNKVSNPTIDQQYFRNEKAFKDEKSKNLVEEVLKEYDSLLYFGQLKYLDSIYQEAVKKQVVQAAKEQEKVTTLSQEKSMEIRKDITTKAKSNPSKKDKATSTHSVSNPDFEEKNRQQAKQGGDAENMVYQKYCELYGKEKVTWHSYYAKKAGINSMGKDGLGYDLTYTNEAEETVYVEVKSTGGSTGQFYMSLKELAVAQDVTKQHEIAFVQLTKDGAQLIPLKNWFHGENPTYNMTPNSYLIEFEIEIESPN
ncbi:DUF3883 domain-containing protein (plasmid) [Entomospira entomophila]|uniref:DUF3883 domain-containing protein n=1 Tax=Entomospira entomophila TaxID=2719988 RepID=A0A968GAF3_9SPIO|nr:DUF3883 domain-containing protein [Entomospira entomophilus]NIZ41568.1 DUF3883 domain-containing protein [Entomospira entomophilus]WDI36453.1 DUF3883 domain-containing protein [Entomospira entomophilus]